MTNKKNWLYVAVILVVANILMFSYLGSQPLLDPDEPVYAETAREMLQVHDFISPRIYGDFWFDKPPMYYWLVAGAFKIFGIGEFSARFPSAFFAVGGAILVYLSGRKLFTERAGLLAALVLVTSLEYFYLGNAAVTDMTLTFSLTAALLSFLHRKYYLLYGFAALAVVTKGPVAIFFCGVIIGLYLVLTGNLKTMKRMKLVSGGALFAVIALPWYVAMYSLHGMAFIDTFLGFHNVTRFLQPEHVSGAIWYYYIPVLFLGFFPWTAFLA
ncbi:MAG: arnT 1, partial [Sporomusa sp.]|nr:arnT 1 [Sporomusa sp.]